MTGSGLATTLHADLDAFYASVEQIIDPTLQGRPIAVGGSVVLAASYEARAFGVHAGMSAWSARRLCPDLRVVSGHFREYQRLGDEVMAVFEDFTPLVERVSVDEAFLDVAGATRLFGPPAQIAEAIRARVRTELRLPLSVGVARTKHLAKVASQVAKPDGLVVVEPEREEEFLDPLPVGLIWGVGPTTQRRLHQSGIRTVGELARAGSPVLERLLGRAAGTKLASLSANIDPRRVQTADRMSSMGAQSALGRRPATPETVRQTLGYLADRVGSRLRAAGVAGRTVSVRIRFADLRSVTRSTTLSVPVSSTLTLTEMAMELQAVALGEHPEERFVSLLGISVSHLVGEVALQLELPLRQPGDHHRPGRPQQAARSGVDRSVDAIRTRFGRSLVGYAGVVLDANNRVPEEFRELAERSPAETATARTAARPIQAIRAPAGR